MVLSKEAIKIRNKKGKVKCNQIAYVVFLVNLPDKQQKIINLFAYYYKKGKKYINPIGSVIIGQEFMVRILFGKDSFKVRFRDFEMKYIFQIPKTKIRYFNFPYFGGGSKTPWDMYVFMKMQESI